MSKDVRKVRQLQRSASVAISAVKAATDIKTKRQAQKQASEAISALRAYVGKPKRSPLPKPGLSKTLQGALEYKAQIPGERHVMTDGDQFAVVADPGQMAPTWAIVKDLPGPIVLPMKASPAKFRDALAAATTTRLDELTSQVGLYLVEKGMDPTRTDKAATLPELLQAFDQATGIGAVVQFRSGVSTMADLRGYQGAGAPVGVSLHTLESRKYDELRAAVLAYSHDQRVFVDSGAFSAFKKGQAIDFDNLVESYAAMLLEGKPENLSLVMPDIIGDQAGTLAMLTKYAREVRQFIESGADIIVPLQGGKLSPVQAWEATVEALGTTEFRLGIPSNKVPLSVEDIGAILKSDNPPKRLHFLGLSEARRGSAYSDRVELTKGLDVTMDAVRHTAQFGRNRNKTTGEMYVRPGTQLADRIAAAQAEGVFADLAPGELLDYAVEFGTVTQLQALARAAYINEADMADAIEKDAVHELLADAHQGLLDQALAQIFAREATEGSKAQILSDQEARGLAIEAGETARAGGLSEAAAAEQLTQQFEMSWSAAVELLRNTFGNPPFDAARVNAAGEAWWNERSKSKAAELESTPAVPQPAGKPPGRTSFVVTGKGDEVETAFRMVEASQLVPSNTQDGRINPDYSQELQPRDRTRKSSALQIHKMASKLRPAQLTDSGLSSHGAPIIGPDRMVESGNGRTMAILKAYAQGSADGYRQYLVDNAERFGFSAGVVEKMAAPVLVRERLTEMDRAQFARDSNLSDLNQMSAAETAWVDAEVIDNNMMAMFQPSDAGSLLAASNRQFIQAYLKEIGDTAAAGLMTADGRPTKQLLDRLQNAVFAKAYRNDRLVKLMAEEPDPEIRNILSALNLAAPSFVEMQYLSGEAHKQASSLVADAVEASDGLDTQALDALVTAVDLVRQARDSGQAMEEVLGQQGLFGATDPHAATLAAFISRNNRSAKRMGRAFKLMAEAINAELQRQGQAAGDMFGGAPAELDDVLRQVDHQLELEFGEPALQGGLFEAADGSGRRYSAADLAAMQSQREAVKPRPVASRLSPVAATKLQQIKVSHFDPGKYPDRRYGKEVAKLFDEVGGTVGPVEVRRYPVYHRGLDDLVNLRLTVSKAAIKDLLVREHAGWPIDVYARAALSLQEVLVESVPDVLGYEISVSAGNVKAQQEKAHAEQAFRCRSVLDVDGHHYDMELRVLLAKDGAKFGQGDNAKLKSTEQSWNDKHGMWQLESARQEKAGVPHGEPGPHGSLSFITPGYAPANFILEKVTPEFNGNRRKSLTFVNAEVVEITLTGRQQAASPQPRAITDIHEKRRIQREQRAMRTA